MTALPDIYQIAIDAAIEASKAIIKVYRSDFGINFKEDGSMVTEADLASSKIISAHLSKTNMPITGEERSRNSYDKRAEWDENWSVDPLDGTKMFVQKNDEFSINIAHIKNGRPIFGLIASPVEERILIGGHLGAFVFDYNDHQNPEKWKSLTPRELPNDPVVMTCSRSFTETKYSLIGEIESEYGPLNYIRKGSALKFFDLAEGRADFYLRFAPTMEWDIAAGQAIIEFLGGTVNSLENGEPLRYNKESLYNPFFIVKTKAVR